MTDVRLRILQALRERAGDPVSGEELARCLGLSRAAVWKHITALRQSGYPIEGSPRRGYVLGAVPDLLAAEEIRSGLETRVIGRQIDFRASVTSTNDIARELGRRGAPEGLVVVADEQTAGRGRLRRPWASPPGVGLWMSVLLRPPLPAHELGRLTLAAAVAVVEAVRDGAGVAAGIKWPNDVVVGGRKLCGILTELEADWEQVHFAVVGIGVNVNTPPEAFPPDVREAATSLRIEAGHPVPRAPLARAILAGLERAYGETLAGQFERVLARWRAYTVTLGRPVRVLPVAGGRPPIDGVALDVDGDGALLVRLADGRVERVLAGEVSLRPVP